MRRRTTIQIDEDICEKFVKYLISKHGKIHGVVISKEVEKAILLLIKKQERLSRTLAHAKS